MVGGRQISERPAVGVLATDGGLGLVSLLWGNNRQLSLPL